MPGFIGRLCLIIALGTTKVANHAKNLEMCNWLLQLCLSYNQTIAIHGWALDFVGQIHPASSKGHRFVLIATDYFTKWTEAIPLKNMMHREVIHFISEHIIHKFGIPQTLTTNQGSSFMSHQVREFAESLKIKLLSSSPYYA
jgi:hypothetical protein